MLAEPAEDELAADPPGVTPRIALRAYEEQEGGRATGFVFVPIPNQRGRYVRTQHCVVEVSCPHCESVPGEPCKTQGTGDGYSVNVHYTRPKALRELKRRAAARVRIDITSAPPQPPPSPAPPAPFLRLVPAPSGWDVAEIWRTCSTCGEPVLCAPTHGDERLVWVHIDMTTGRRCAGSATDWSRLPEVEAPGGEP